jgi:hypothetical protein
MDPVIHNVDNYKPLKTVAYPQQITEEDKKQFKRFDIFRYNPTDGNHKSEYISYYIDLKKCGPMVLDALIKIKDEIDPTLAFRR